MYQLLTVFSFKLWSAFKGLLRLRLEAVVKDLASFLILAGFSIAIFFFARFVTTYLLYEAHIGLFLFHRFLSMVLFVFFLAINLGNLVVSYSTLYKTEEVDFLLTLPISYEKVFVVKFLDNFFRSSSTLFLIGISVLVGYGSVFQMPLNFYLFVSVGLLFPFMLLAATLAVILLFGLMKLTSKVKPRQLIIVILFSYLASVIFYFRITNPIRLTEQVMKFYPNVNEYFSQFDPKVITYLPSHWVADALYFLVRGDAAAAFPYVQVLILVTLGSLLLSLLLAVRLYYPTWLLARQLRFQKAPSKAMPVPVLDLQKESFLRPQIEVLLKKDFWQFFREPSQWLHLLIMVFLVLVFVASLSSAEWKITIPFLQTVSFMGMMLFNGFLVASIALRFVFPAISTEGLSFWCIRSGPIRLAKIFWFKFLTSFLFVLLVAEVLSVLSNYSLRAHTPLLLTNVASSLALSIGLVALNLGSGAYFANYREKNAIRVASSQEASLTFLLGLAFLTLVVSILFVPVHQYFHHLIFATSYSQTPLVLSLLVIFGISFVLAASSCYIGLRSLGRDF